MAFLRTYEVQKPGRSEIGVPGGGFDSLQYAEGAGRGSDLDFRRFLRHSLGSCNELEYDLLLARDLGFVPSELHASLSQRLEEVRRMLSGLVRRLTARELRC